MESALDGRWLPEAIERRMPLDPVRSQIGCRGGRPQVGGIESGEVRGRAETAPSRSRFRGPGLAFALVLLAVFAAAARAQEPGGPDGEFVSDPDDARPGGEARGLLGAAGAAEARGNWAAAEQLYRRVLELAPGTPEAERAREGLANLPGPSRRFFGRAASVLLSGPALFLGGVVGFFWLGPWLYHRADAWRRTRSFHRSRRLDFANPMDAGARFQLAEAYYRSGRARKAEPLIHEAIRIAAENPVAPSVPTSYRRLLGLVCLARGRHEEALGAFDAILAAPRDLTAPEVLLGRGKALQGLGRLGEAREAYAKALEANTSLLEAYWRLAVVERRLGDEAASGRTRAAFWSTIEQLSGRSRFSPGLWKWRFRLFGVLVPRGYGGGSSADARSV
ncbi:MAG: tetratricopeptide repeat protein [Planctomycetes bacterium]|nr:tetratricopeptide repeat protein [Planctomycetota bacterium]